MLPYFIVIILSFFFCFVAKIRDKRKLIVGYGELVSKNNLAVFVFFLMLWLLLACRSVEVGTDTENYKYFFATQSNQSLSQIFNVSVEPLFKALNWLIGQVTKNFQIYLAIIGAIPPPHLFRFHHTPAPSLAVNCQPLYPTCPRTPD